MVKKVDNKHNNTDIIKKPKKVIKPKALASKTNRQYLKHETNNIDITLTPKTQQTKKIAPVPKATQPAVIDVTSSSKYDYSQTDHKPDSSQKLTSETYEHMQGPKLFDTKEYYLPIFRTHHKNGFLFGAVVAGLLTAVIASTITYLVYYKPAPNIQAVSVSLPTTNGKTKQQADAVDIYPANQYATLSSRDAEREKDIKSIASKLAVYYANNGKYPADCSQLSNISGISADDLKSPNKTANSCSTETPTNQNDVYQYTVWADGKTYKLSFWSESKQNIQSYDTATQ